MTARGPARTVAALCVLAVGLAVLDACADGGVRDPASPGPYGVGMTTMTFTRTSSTTGEPRPLETVIWYPADGESDDGPTIGAPPATDGGPFPVVTFSRGDSGQPTQSSFFTQHLASWGFVVVAPPHPGNTEDDCPCDAQSLIDSYLNRVPDITFVLQEVLALKDDPSQPIGTIIDSERAAGTGYSFGGLTSILVAPEGLFDAVIAMAPGEPSLLTGPAREARVPVMIMGGQKDEIADPVELHALYQSLPSENPSYEVVLPEGHHHAFQDECRLGCEFSQERAHDLINRYATAFLRTYLVGDKRYGRFLEESEPPDALITHRGQ